MVGSTASTSDSEKFEFETNRITRFGRSSFHAACFSMCLHQSITFLASKGRGALAPRVWPQFTSTERYQGAAAGSRRANGLWGLAGQGCSPRAVLSSTDSSEISIGVGMYCRSTLSATRHMCCSVFWKVCAKGTGAGPAVESRSHSSKTQGQC